MSTNVDVDELAGQLDHHLDIKPPLISSNSAPPVLQSDDIHHVDYTFGTCPSPANQSDFLGTPATEKGAFEYPESCSASSSRRPSLIHPSLRRGSSTSSTNSTVTSFSTATRRPSLAPAYTPTHSGPIDYDNFRRRGSLAHFPTRVVQAPIPPSILARRGSLPAADALFGIPSNERSGHSRSSLSTSSPFLTTQSEQNKPTSNSPIQRHASLRLRMPPSAFARRGSLQASPGLTEPVLEQGEPNTHIRSARIRQASSSSSAQSSSLSRSSFSSEDSLQYDESTDEASAVDTPGSASENEQMGLFSDPWQGGDAVTDKSVGAEPGVERELAASF